MLGCSAARLTSRKLDPPWEQDNPVIGSQRGFCSEQGCRSPDGRMRSNGCCLTGREVDPDMGRLLGLGQTSQRRLGRAGQILGLRVLIFLLIPSLLITPVALSHVFD